MGAAHGHGALLTLTAPGKVAQALAPLRAAEPRSRSGRGSVLPDTCQISIRRSNCTIAQNVGPTDAAALHDELLRSIPEGARHNADICPFCVDQATQDAGVPASGPSGLEPSGAAHDPQPEEGGTTDMSNDENISRETHEALLEKALKDATSTTEAALERQIEAASESAKKITELETANAELKSDNERLNKELDEAQVQLKTATDEVASLKADVAAKDEAARKAEIASARAEQVENLGLFSKEYITEKASAWADLADDAWTDRLDEWKNLKPLATADSSTDSASALSGTSEELTSEPTDEAKSNPVPARRAALGLSS